MVKQRTRKTKKAGKKSKVYWGGAGEKKVALETLETLKGQIEAINESTEQASVTPAEEVPVTPAEEVPVTPAEGASVTPVEQQGGRRRRHSKKLKGSKKTRRHRKH